MTAPMTIEQAVEKLPRDFLYGVATSSYQIEGSGFGDCGRSQWDDFAAAGKTRNGENGAVACEHYHRYAEDLDLIQQGGFGAYRFSFSWARLLPENDNTPNPKGIDFYDRLIDGMLQRGLRPFATLYHWDLPSRLAAAGGWRERDIAHRFADYSALVARHFGDRLEAIAPINEPWCVAWLSHYDGEHAPGMRDIAAATKAMHYVLLAHGLAIAVLREAGCHNLGCVLNKEYPVPVDESDMAKEKTELFDGVYNRWFEEAIFNGRYPPEVLAVLAPYMPDGYESDFKHINAPLDWVGVNYYTRAIIVPDPDEPHLGFRSKRGDLPKTDMGWEIAPEGLSFFLRRLAERYAPGLPLYITENGMANRDRVVDGRVDDNRRVDYFAAHLAQIVGLVEAGLPIRGYFAWSLLDNFEWALGYDKRFGLVHVDYDTQTRTPKKSYLAWQAALGR